MFWSGKKTLTFFKVKDKFPTNNVTNLQRTEDSHEPITGDGGEGENAGDDANHRVERVQLAEHSWKRK